MTIACMKQPTRWVYVNAWVLHSIILLLTSVSCYFQFWATVYFVFKGYAVLVFALTMLTVYLATWFTLKGIYFMLLCVVEETFTELQEMFRRIRKR